MGSLRLYRWRSSASAGPRDSAGRVLLQALQADRSPGRAAPSALSLRGGSGGCSLTCVERLDHAVAAERGPAGQQGVEDRAQAVDVGRRRDRAPPARRLLGGHVGRRAEDGARLAVSSASASTRLARPKSVTCGWPCVVDQDVGRLEVAVEDAPHVGVVHRLGRLGQQRARRPAGRRGRPPAGRRGCRRRPASCEK